MIGWGIPSFYTAWCLWGGFRFTYLVQLIMTLLYMQVTEQYHFFFREFQFMAFALDDSSLLSYQDINQFLM